MRGVSGPGCVVAGRYELLDRIGQGAMGTVWRARDQVLARDYPAYVVDHDATSATKFASSFGP